MRVELRYRRREYFVARSDDPLCRVVGGEPSPAPTDLRVPELLFSDWSQDRIGNWAGTDYPYCFNMYTPEIDGERAPCGCVATSGAQIMRYFQYPTASVTAQTKTCKVSGVDTNLTMMGGTYDWSNMPHPQNSLKSQLKKTTDLSCRKRRAGGLTNQGGMCYNADNLLWETNDVER